MDLRGISSTDIFIPTGQQSQLEELANNALSKGIDLYMRQEYEGAIKEFRRSIGLAPNSSFSVDAASYMADAHLASEDTEGAMKAYETALRLNPFRDDIHISLGNLYFAEERYEESGKSYEKAVKLRPIADNHYALGQAYMNTDRYTDAETQFNNVLRIDPDNPNGNYGLGLNYSRQGRYEDAIVQFKAAVNIDSEFYDSYAELGYAYAELGEMEESQRIVDFLENVAPGLGDTLSRYMYKVDPPKFMFAHATSGFNYNMPWKTPLSALNGYLAAPNAEKTFTMNFQFDKEMERESVENVLNWGIGRSTQSGPGQAYNFNRPIPDTEVTLPPFPKHVYYDKDNLTATVYFTVRQNPAGDGTLDPAHLEFKFSGEDAYGHKMDPDFDQFMGFSGVA